MSVNLAQTKIRKLIVHEIPRNLVGGGAGSPILSDVISPIDDDVKGFFENRLRFTLDDAFPVEFLPVAPRARVLTEEYLSRKIDFVAYSRELATHLFSVQTGVNSPGLLCVAAVRNAGAAGVAMLKLEKEEGLRVKREGTSGRETLSVLHVRDLMLTNKTRVFKAAMILPGDPDLAHQRRDLDPPEFDGAVDLGDQTWNSHCVLLHP